MVMGCVEKKGIDLRAAAAASRDGEEEKSHINNPPPIRARYLFGLGSS
jgi:hypothetical protein